MSFSFVSGQEQNVDLTFTRTYLINNDGMLVNSWDSDYVPGNSIYLLENGDLLRAADQGGNTIFIAEETPASLEQVTFWSSTMVPDVRKVILLPSSGLYLYTLETSTQHLMA